MCSEQVLGAREMYGNISTRRSRSRSPNIWPCHALHVAKPVAQRLPYRATVTAGGGMGGVDSGRGRRMSSGLRDELPRGKRYMVRMGSVGRTSWRGWARVAGIVANNFGWDDGMVGYGGVGRCYMVMMRCDIQSYPVHVTVYKCHSSGSRWSAAVPEVIRIGVTS
jgi:hypothetical protein